MDFSLDSKNNSKWCSQAIYSLKLKWSHSTSLRIQISTTTKQLIRRHLNQSSHCKHYSNIFNKRSSKEQTICRWVLFKRPSLLQDRSHLILPLPKEETLFKTIFNSNKCPSCQRHSNSKINRVWHLNFTMKNSAKLNRLRAISARKWGSWRNWSKICRCR